MLFLFPLMSSFRNSIFKCLYRCGYGNYLLKKNRKAGKIPVLVFHRIIPEYDRVWPGIHPHLFEDIILLLKKHYRILPLEDLYTKPVQELEHACFITFDDGYKDYLDYAYPILKKHQVPSALFVLPYQIANKGHIWTSTIIFFVKHYSFPEIRQFFREHDADIPYTNSADDFQLNLDITVYLCNFNQERRMKMINALHEKFVSDNRIIENELLSFDELRLLDPRYVTIASHSLTHPSFKSETDPGFLQSELAESKHIIEQETRQHVEAFAFPFSNYNTASISVAKKLYRICFTGINEFVSLQKLESEPDYKYDMPRFNVHHHTAEEAFFLINGFHKKLSR